MKNPLILHIETATDICSVAISEGDQQLASAESGPERSHATLLNSFIRKCLQESNKEVQELEAISVSKGPGSYTGLRIGVSTSKGLAYGLQKPLLSTGTLQSMAAGASSHSDIQELIHKHGSDLILCPMLDARRMEVYTGFLSQELEVVREVTADIVNEASFGEILEKNKVCFFGNGADKCQEVIKHPNAYFIKGFNPSASHMIKPVLKRFKEQQFEDVAYFEPFYLKDFVATTPKKKLL